MKSMIYCEPTKRGVHSFYLVMGGKKYYLFSQKYRKGVHRYFSKGVSVNQSIDYSKAHKDTALKKTMSKIPMYLKYIEKEWDLQILEKTKRKNKKDSLVKCA